MPSKGHEVEEGEVEEGGVDPQTISIELKRQHPAEWAGSQKKVKASKLSIDPITLTEVDLHDIGKMVHDAANEALQDFIQENQIVLGALRAQLQELQERPP